MIQGIDFLKDFFWGVDGWVHTRNFNLLSIFYYYGI